MVYWRPEKIINKRTEMKETGQQEKEKQRFFIFQLNGTNGSKSVTMIFKTSDII